MLDLLAKAVYDLMSARGVDFVVQNGDLDYSEDPLVWENFVVGRGLELLVSSGNHEEQAIYNYKWVSPICVAENLNIFFN